MHLDIDFPNFVSNSMVPLRQSCSTMMKTYIIPFLHFRKQTTISRIPSCSTNKITTKTSRAIVRDDQLNQSKFMWSLVGLDPTASPSTDVIDAKVHHTATGTVKIAIPSRSNVVWSALSRNLNDIDTGLWGVQTLHHRKHGVTALLPSITCRTLREREQSQAALALVVIYTAVIYWSERLNASVDKVRREHKMSVLV